MALKVSDSKKGKSKGKALTQKDVADVIVWVSPEVVHPNNYNPNVMDPAKFEMLSEDIEEEEILDTPIVVIPHPDKNGEYQIVDGEHRHRVASNAKMPLIPITIKSWTEFEAKMHTVRRNIIHGEMDKGKFSQLMHNLQNESSLSVQDVRKRMGFATEKELGRIFKVAKIDRTNLPKYEQETDTQKKVSKAVGLTSSIVRTVLEEYGVDAAEGVFMFTCAGKPVISFAIPKKTKPVLENLIDVMNDDLDAEETQEVMHNILLSMVEVLEANGS